MISDTQAETFASTACTNVLKTDSVGEITCLFAVALLESSFGSGWKGDGVGSHNQGAVQCGGWSGDRFYYIDTHPNPDGTSTQYRACFRKYNSEQAGWDDLAAIMYTGRREPVMRAAIAEDWRGVSQALYDTGYYEGFGKTPTDRVTNHDIAMRKGIARCLAVLALPVVDPPPQPAPAVIPDTIRYGSTGDTVRMVQRWLPGIVADGIYGRATVGAVQAYQSEHSLFVDGAIGPRTWASLFSDHGIPIVG